MVNQETNATSSLDEKLAKRLFNTTEYSQAQKFAQPDGEPIWIDSEQLDETDSVMVRGDHIVLWFKDNSHVRFNISGV